jgi:ABC-2 type transport system permease protein
MIGTLRTSPLPLSVPQRLGWAVTDCMTIVGRELNHLRRAPSVLIGALVFPALMVVMFGYVFGSAISVPGGGNYREYLMPGLFAMTTVTSVMITAVRVATDVSKGVMDRFRSMPIARVAVPFGMTGADIIAGALAMTVMVGCGLVVGWRPRSGLGASLAAFGLLVLLRYAVTWVGVFIGLAVRSEETADQWVPIVFPVTMISNAFVPTSGMPSWLRTIADWNPVSVAVAATRQLFGNPGGAVGHTAWPLEHAVVASLLWSLLLLAIFVPLSVWRYRTVKR